jgi:hypothetical protein
MRGTCIPVPTGFLDPHGGCHDEGAATCGHDGACDGRGGCRLYPPGVTCATMKCSGATISFASQCDGKGTCQRGPTFSCAPFACNPVNNLCFNQCETNDQCFAAQCEFNSCQMNRVTPCAADSECASGFCSQGVCCDARCDGPCVSCALATSTGHCTGVPAGAPDPKGLCQDQGPASCGTNGTCDPFGGCATYPLGTTCSAPSCTNGTLVLAGQCNALQKCIIRTASCAPYVCRDDAPLCRQSDCGTDADCAAGFFCAASSVCLAKPP